MKLTFHSLVRRCIQKGYTIRTNKNPDFMRAISKWAKDKGTEVGKAIRAGETKQAIKLLVDAQNLKNGMRRATENSDRLVYDKNEIAIYWYETATETLYALEQ